jgi:hypothetical protein
MIYKILITLLENCYTLNLDFITEKTNIKLQAQDIIRITEE